MMIGLTDEFVEDGRTCVLAEEGGTVFLLASGLPAISLPNDAAILARLSNEDIRRLNLRVPCHEQLPGRSTMTVTIVDRQATDALWGHASRGISVVRRTVIISDACPRCGGKRGTPWWRQFCEDDEWFPVHVWENPCGHVDHYRDVLAEAERLLSEQPRENGGGS